MREDFPVVNVIYAAGYLLRQDWHFRFQSFLLFCYTFVPHVIYVKKDENNVMFAGFQHRFPPATENRKFFQVTSSPHDCIYIIFNKVGFELPINRF